MKPLKHLFLFLFFASFFLLSAQSQSANQPFAHEIEAFKKSDSLQAPPQNAILFVGSSSFRLWPNVQSYFPEHTIINRGFGGSSLPDVIQYAEEIIFPYQPKQIVIYCGENDLAGSDTVSAQTVLARFTQLFTLIRSKLPNTPVAFVSIKPSPSRQHLMPKIAAANKLIRRYLKKQRKTKYVNVYDAMLNADGTPKADLFVEDNLHMNEKGYAIWKKKITPALKK